MRWVAIAATAAAGCSARPAAPPPRPVVANAAATPADAPAASVEEPREAPPDLRPDLTSPMIGQPLPPMPPACTNAALRLDTQDVNADGKPDVWIRFETHPSGRDVVRCKQIDFDADGRLDLARLYDLSTTKELLELDDFDFDGRMDVAMVHDLVTGQVTILRDLDADGIVDRVEH